MKLSRQQLRKMMLRETRTLLEQESNAIMGQMDPNDPVGQSVAIDSVYQDVLGFLENAGYAAVANNPSVANNDGSRTIMITGTGEDNQMVYVTVSPRMP